MHVEQAGTGFFDRFDNIGAGARGVPNIHTKSNARVHTLDRFQNTLRRREIFILRSVVVYGNLDVVLLHVLFQFGQSLRSGRTDNQREAGAFGIFEFALDIGLIVLGETHVTAAHQDDTGIREFLFGRIDFLRRGIEFQMELFNVQVRRAQVLRHLDRLGTIELPERV